MPTCIFRNCKLILLKFGCGNLQNPGSGRLDKEFFKKSRRVAKQPDRFKSNREVVGEHRLAPGTYCIVPSTFEPDQETEYLLRIYTEKPIVCRCANFPPSPVSHSLRSSYLYHSPVTRRVLFRIWNMGCQPTLRGLLPSFPPPLPRFCFPPLPFPSLPLPPSLEVGPSFPSLLLPFPSLTSRAVVTR